MFDKDARAPYTPLPIVGLLVPSVLRVPNSTNNGATKSMYSQFEGLGEKVRHDMITEIYLNVLTLQDYISLCFQPLQFIFGMIIAHCRLYIRQCD